jgi:threonine/homoserine/homoserine lactone efflux protein
VTLPVDPHLYLIFLGAMVVMAMTPGPAVLYAVAQGVERGRRAVFEGVAGINTAMIVWFTGAALGLSAVFAAHPGVFRWLAVAGAVYVAWLGVQSILSALKTDPQVESPQGSQGAPPAPRGSPFAGGFAVQIANPKVLLFFTAVLPPFVDADRAVGPQLLLFALGTLTLDIAFMTAYGLGGAALTERMTRPSFRRGFGLFTGGLLLVVAVLILLRLRG